MDSRHSVSDAQLMRHLMISITNSIDARQVNCFSLDVPTLPKKESHKSAREQQEMMKKGHLQENLNLSCCGAMTIIARKLGS